MKALRLLVVALSLASAALAQTPSTDKLLKALQDSLELASKANDPDTARAQSYVAALHNALAARDYAEAGRMLTGLRGTPLGSSEKTGGIIDQLLTNIRTEAAAVAAARDAELDALISDVRAKFAKRAPAAEFDPLLLRLAKLGAAAGSYNDPSRMKFEAVRVFVTRWQDYLLQTAQGNFEQAAAILNQLIEIAGQQGIVPRSELSALQAEGAAKVTAARVSRSDAATVRVQALTKSVQAALDAAKIPADLDAILAEISKPLSTDPNSGGFSNSVNSQLDSLRRFVLRWQEYLAQIVAGNDQAATNILRDLSNDSSTTAFFPRSRILALLDGSAPKKISTAATEPLVTPDELNLETLNKLVLQLYARNDRGTLPGMEDLAGEAVRLRAAYGQLKLGNTFPAVAGNSAFSGSMGRVGPYAFALARVQQALVVRALPSYVEAPPDLTSSDNETPMAYLRRVVQRGRQTKDWQLVYRALKAAQSLNLRFGPGNDWVSIDVTGYHFFFQAMNAERAGQWTDAIRSYLFAMHTDGPDLPAEEIGTRLSQLKGAHPQEFEAAQGISEYAGRVQALSGGLIIPGGSRPDLPAAFPRANSGVRPPETEPAPMERPPPQPAKAPDGSGTSPAKAPDATGTPPAATK